MPKCHQPVWLGEKYLKQFRTYLYQRGLTYRDIFTVNEKESMIHVDLLQNIKELFVHSHMMYWSVLSDTDELELIVPSTINPLTEVDVCTTLRPAN